MGKHSVLANKSPSNTLPVAGLRLLAAHRLDSEPPRGQDRAAAATLAGEPRPAGAHERHHVGPHADMAVADRRPESVAADNVHVESR